MIHYFVRVIAIPLGTILAGILHPILNLILVGLILGSYYLLASYWEFHGDESETPGSPAIRIGVLKTLDFFHGAWGTTLAMFFAFFIASSIFHIGESDAPPHGYTEKPSR